MRRVLHLAALLVCASAFAVPAYGDESPGQVPPCARIQTCLDAANPTYYDGQYIGHDEPSLGFYSNTPGSGTNQHWRLIIPTEPTMMPTQPQPPAQTDGATWNFELHPAFWFGVAVCDTESAPEFSNQCTPGSDTNIYNDANPNSPHYIGRHPGTAFTEIQFYPPGWAPLGPAISCDPTRWCAALTIDSFNENLNTGVPNNADCLSKVTVEPQTFAFITRSGVPQGPPSPLLQTAASRTPDPAKDLFFNQGDEVTVDVSDTPAGMSVVMHDLTTGESGSMVASVANGFAQVNYRPNAQHCTQTPYAFHPMYSTASEQTRVPWAAHTYNVAYSDEIGHFEFCKNVIQRTFSCGDGGVQDDDFGCFSAAVSLLVPVGGCTGSDLDFDGTGYRADQWPGTGPNALERRLHSTPIMFTSPTFNGGMQYDRMAFETDLPRIEATDFGGPCHRDTGQGCTNPPPGAQFYPIFTSTMSAGHCWWQEGGNSIPGTLKTFGGNSKRQYGPLLRVHYPGVGGPEFLLEDFRRKIPTVPCKY